MHSSPHQTTRPPLHLGPLIILAAIPFIMVLGNSMLIPVLPRMMKVLHITLFQSGLMITAFSLPAGLVIAFAGVLSDRIGRIRVIVPALIIYGLGGLAAGLAAWLLPHPFYWMLAARIVQGIGAGGTYQLAMAVVGDRLTGKERVRALGWLESSNGLGKVISPLSGSALALIIWFLPFFAYGLLALPVSALLAFTFRRAMFSSRRTHAAPSNYSHRLKEFLQAHSKSLGVSALSGASGLWLLFGILSVASDGLETHYGYGELMRGLLIAVPVLFSATTATILSSMWPQGLSHHIRGVTFIGLLGVALAVGAQFYWLFHTVIGLIIGFIIQGIGTGGVLSATNVFITEAAPKALRGSVTSLYGSLRFFGVALGPPWFSQAISHPLLVFGAAAAWAVLLAFFVLITLPQTAHPLKKKAQPHTSSTQQAIGFSSKRF
ncbi:MAG: MFS transporter [Firmicutes bacterium]|nr:MFS transporter [Bacillota bacterium]